MILTSFSIQWVIIASVIVAIALLLLLVSGLASNAIAIVGKVRAFMLLFTQNSWSFNRKIWNLAGEEMRLQHYFNRIVAHAVSKQSNGRNLTSSQVEAIKTAAIAYYGAPSAPTEDDIIGVWTRRFAYLILNIFLEVGDFLLTEARVWPLLAEGNQQPFLSQFLFIVADEQIALIVLWTLLSILAGLLLQDITGSHSQYVRIRPYLPLPTRVILAIIILLTYGGTIAVNLIINSSAFEGTHLTQLHLIVFTVLLVLNIVTISMSFPAMLDALQAFASMQLACVVTIIYVILATVCMIGIGILHPLAALNGMLVRARRR